MDVLTIVLVVLVVAAIWLVIEIALTVRKARPVLKAAQKTIDDVAPVVSNVNDLVEQAKPLIANVNEAVSAAKPGVAQLDPVLVQAADALGKVDAILGDVSHISKTAGNATVAVGDAAESIASKARSFFTRGRSAARAAMPATTEESSDSETATQCSGEGALNPAPVPEVVSEEVGYFTYPSANASNTADAKEDAAK